MSAASNSFLVGDWGTSSLRLWRLAPDGGVLAEARGADGLTAVVDRAFEAVLERHLATLGAAPGEPVVLCGMVGARTGWVEAAYLPVPLGLSEIAPEATRVPGIRRPVFILPGLSQNDPTRPDVMRGEETQLLGLVALEGATPSGLVCMPGTHSKWVRLEEGRLSGFSTAMTGEVFALLRRHSVLAGVLDAQALADPASAGFVAAVRESLDAPAEVLSRLFALRAGFLLHGTPPSENLSRLSGLLIGAEIAAARSRWGELDGVRLVASGAMAEVYLAALQAAGIHNPSVSDADACSRAGLALAARRLAARNANEDAA